MLGSECQDADGFASEDGIEGVGDLGVQLKMIFSAREVLRTNHFAVWQ